MSDEQPATQQPDGIPEFLRRSSAKEPAPSIMRRPPSKAYATPPRKEETPR